MILICIRPYVWHLMDDELWYPICYVSQKWYSWDCDVWHNRHLDLKIRVLTGHDKLYGRSYTVGLGSSHHIVVEVARIRVSARQITTIRTQLYGRTKIVPPYSWSLNSLYPKRKICRCQKKLSTPGFLSPDAYYVIHRNPRITIFARHNRLDIIVHHPLHAIHMAKYK